LPVSGLYEVLAHTALEGDQADLCDVGLVLSHANQPLPLIKNSRWKFGGYRAVDIKATVGEVTLASGDKLRITRDTMMNTKSGDELKIHCFQENDDDPTLVQVVFTDGRVMEFNRANLECVEMVLDNGESKAFSVAKIESLPGGQVVTDVKLGDGMQVKYLGGDSGVNRDFNERIAKETPATILICHNRRISERDTIWRVQFDKRFSGLHGSDDRCQDIHGRYLKPLGALAEVDYYYSFGNSRVLKKHDQSLISLPLELDPGLELAHRGKNISRDTYDQMVSVGDIVIPLSTLSHSASVRSAIGVPGIVISYGSSYHHYVILYHGRDVDAGSIADLYSRDTFESKFKTQSYHGKLTVYWANDCERVELVRALDDSPCLSVRSLVQIKKGVRPKDGFLGVRRNAIGVITDISEGYVQVNFPGNPEWIGLFDEVEGVDFTPEVGTRVRVKPEVALTCLRGNVADTDVGEVKQLEDGQLIVDFPRHHDWLGSPCDLMAAS